MTRQQQGTEDRYRYRAHVRVTVDPVAEESEARITVEAPLSLQTVEAVVTVALAQIRTMAQVDPAMLNAGRQLLGNLPAALDRIVQSRNLMHVEVVPLGDGVATSGGRANK
jgi:hypothetical protein